MASEPVVRRRLGRGRSGVVFAEVTPDGRAIAAKLFLPDVASTVVQTVLTGAANPYRWNADAVECAVLRRRILELLVPRWTGGLLRLPPTDGFRFDPQARAFELRAGLVRGRHAMLRHPDCRPVEAGEIDELWRGILVPLQKHLAEAGFDGLLWQAGRGNPAATANFMRDPDPQAPTPWVWIDAESGVPALFPLNPWHLLATYLPLSLKHGRWLFDDVDVPRLQAWLAAHEGELAAELGPARLAELGADAAALGAAQARWKALSRHGRSVQSHHVTGDIDDEQLAWYLSRPVRWLVRLAAHLGLDGLFAAGRGAWRLLRWLRPRKLLSALAGWSRFLLSQRVRMRWARHHVHTRVREWRGRGFLDVTAARELQADLQDGSAAEYIADFGVQLAIKPAIKVLVLVLAPLLGLLGVVDDWWVIGFLALYGGAIGRTVYGLARLGQAAAHGRPLPWVALACGTLPVVGNAGYPLQLLAETQRGDGRLARFLVHDIFAGVGRHLPIWGGKDTLLEHRANALIAWRTRGPGGGRRTRAWIRLKGLDASTKV